MMKVGHADGVWFCVSQHVAPMSVLRAIAEARYSAMISRVVIDPGRGGDQKRQSLKFSSAAALQFLRPQVGEKFSQQASPLGSRELKDCCHQENRRYGPRLC